MANIDKEIEDMKRLAKVLGDACEVSRKAEKERIIIGIYELFATKGRYDSTGKLSKEHILIPWVDVLAIVQGK